MAESITDISASTGAPPAHISLASGDEKVGQFTMVALPGISTSKFPRFAALLLTLTVVGIAAYSALERGQLIMSQKAFASSSVVPKPLVDAYAPKQMATATFAMG